MSANIQSGDDDEQQPSVNFEIQQLSSTTDEEYTSLINDKQQLFVEKANNTFRELCQTLENEQNKLLELDERRKILLEEMLLLKAEIEEEKQSLSNKIVQSAATNLQTLNRPITQNVCDQSKVDKENLEAKRLRTGYEEDWPQTARNFTGTPGEELTTETLR